MRAMLLSLSPFYMSQNPFPRESDNPQLKWALLLQLTQGGAPQPCQEAQLPAHSRFCSADNLHPLSQTYPLFSGVFLFCFETGSSLHRPDCP